MVTPYNGSNISQTHHKISVMGPTDVRRLNTIPYKWKEPCKNK